MVGATINMVDLPLILELNCVNFVIYWEGDVFDFSLQVYIKEANIFQP